LVGYRDGAGRRLEDYPRPAVAVDTAVLTVTATTDGGLSVLVVKRHGSHRTGSWQLPGTFLHEGETLADAALRALQAKAGAAGLLPRQLQVLDGPGRDDRGWVISVAHVDVVPIELLESALEPNVKLLPVNDATGLAFDHDLIVTLATETIRADYQDRPDPARLLSGSFTLLQLQELHEAVSGTRLPKDTFRRRMQSQLRETGQISTGTVGKPARLWEQVKPTQRR
jgi:8-oxo-dGTP diphosphatase